MTKKTSNNRQISAPSVFPFLEEEIRLKRVAGRISTADLYRASTNWLYTFWGSNKLVFTAITPAFVDRFHTFLRGQKHLKENSIVSYMSNVRAMYNAAIRAHLIKEPEIHPFAHLSLKGEKTAKRAVDKNVIKELASLHLEGKPRLQLVQDACLFSYLACGIPFVDLAHLTRQNIVGEDLTYNRIKTGTPIRVRITEGMQRLIRKYASDKTPYLFPFLPPGDTYADYKQTLRRYNEGLKEIGLQLTTPIHLTSYVIRHTWATEALRQHTPVAVISQALGHTQEKTTRHYLAALDQSELNEANRLIIGGIDELVGMRA